MGTFPSALVQVLQSLRGIPAPLWSVFSSCSDLCVPSTVLHSFLFPSLPVVISVLIYVFTEVAPAWLMDSALSCGGSILKPAVRSEGQPMASSQKGHLCSALLPKPWNLYPIHPSNPSSSPVLIPWRRGQVQWSCYHWLLSAYQYHFYNHSIYSSMEIIVYGFSSLNGEFSFFKSNALTRSTWLVYWRFSSSRSGGIYIQLWKTHPSLNCLNQIFITYENLRNLIVLKATA